jgi:hypothetical protein
MLQGQPALTRVQALDCLVSAARSDNDTANGPASGWGAGKLDICAALACVTGNAR